eukprot:UN11883
MVCEEVLLKNFNAPALVIVGMEGCWGVICMVFILLIWQYTTEFPQNCINNFKEQCSDPDNAEAESIQCSTLSLYHEDTGESMKMSGDSTTLAILLVIYLVAILMYNISGMT